VAKRTKTSKADIKIRLIEGLRKQIEQAAKENGQSMNAEMITRLAASFHNDTMRDLIKLELEQAMRRAGYTPVTMPKGGYMWAEPGFDFDQVNLAIDVAALVKEAEPGLVRVLADALGKFAKKPEGERS
jgi:hypothetical protein